MTDSTVTDSTGTGPTLAVPPADDSSSSRGTARRGHPTAVLLIVLTSYFMIVLDNSIVFTGLTRIREDLAFATSSLSWVQTAYALAFGGLLLLGARAGDLLGRRRVFVAGLTIFSLASLAIGLAPSAEWMLVARAVQGVGSAIIAPTSLALLTAHFPAGPERTRAVAAYGSTAGIGASVGLVVGGLLADLLSWRVGFLLNVPIGAVLLVATLRLAGDSPRLTGQFDVGGAIASTLGMTALVYGITRSADAGWADPLTIANVAVGTVVLAVFVLIEWRAPAPILPLRVFVDRIRFGAFLARLLLAGAMFGYFFFISQYMQGVLGFTPLQAGAGFLPMSVVQFAVAVLVPRLTRRFGNSTLVVAGLAVMLVGMLLLSGVGTDSDYWLAVAWPMLLLGAGQGLCFAPLTAAGITAIRPDDAGAASGLVNVAHQLGGALGVSVMVAVAASGTVASTSPAALAAETSAALTTGSLLLAIGLVASVALIVSWRRAGTARASS